MTESMDSVDDMPLNQQLGKENKTYDYIFVTTNLNFDMEYLEEFLTTDGRLVNTYEAEVSSDDFVFVTKYFYSVGRSLNINYQLLLYFISLSLSVAHQLQARLLLPPAYEDGRGGTSPVPHEPEPIGRLRQRRGPANGC